MDLLGLDKLEPALAAQVQTIANGLEASVQAGLAATVTEVTGLVQNMRLKGTITINVDLALAPGVAAKKPQ